MNLLDALKTGNPCIRRKVWNQWYDCIGNGGSISIKTSDALASDWEVKEPTVQVSRSAFWAATPKFPDAKTITPDQLASGLKQMASLLELE